MTSRLTCRSFHSVKGGVGKSTLAVAHALSIAQKRAHTGERVYLLDLDLTGTSLADVLPLRAPRWKDVDPLTLGDTVRAPDDGYHSHAETEERVRQRDEQFDDFVNDGPAQVAFLNDFLLFQSPDREGGIDMALDAMCWRLEGAPDNLRVIPSSALPRDLERILPVIFDEYHSGFIEARLEQLLAALIPDEGESYLVVDVPPTIPGLSRVVLSLAMRLARSKKMELSEDGGTPSKLLAADLDWRCHLVVSEDIQDVRAASRWLVRLREDERDYVRLVVNRTRDERDTVVAHIERALRPRLSSQRVDEGDPGGVGFEGFSLATGAWRQELEVFLGGLIAVKDDPSYRFFRGGPLSESIVDPLADDAEQ